MDAAAPPPVPAVDPARTSLLRDVLAGGHIAQAERDRGLAKAILRLVPVSGDQMAAANDFHRRAARWAVAGGTPDNPCQPAGGVIFASSGYPLPGGFHAEAASVAPRALFAYVEADPAAVAYNRALLAKREPLRVSAYQAAAYEPGRVLGAPAAQVILDRGPVMVQLQMCCHWWSSELCTWVLGEYKGRLPSGSSVALSVGVAGNAAGYAELAAEVTRIGVAPQGHRVEDVAGWFAAAGLPLITEITDVRGRGWAAAEIGQQEVVTRVVQAVALVP
jgi:hypothetical protein